MRLLLSLVLLAHIAVPVHAQDAPMPVIPASAAGVPAPPAEEIATALFARFDLGAPECQDYAALLRQARPLEALELWRDRVVQRLRAHDFGEYGWHEYARHPRSVGSIDALLGKPPRQEYLNSPMVGFVDIYGMTGLPGKTPPVNWYTHVDDVTDWGGGDCEKWDRTVKMERTDYGNFEFAKSFTARYWETGDEVYLDKALDLFSDFSRNHARGFWEVYFANQGLPDKFVWEKLHVDWRLNTNALQIGWRLKNFLKVLAGLTKCLGPDKPAEWKDVLAPALAELPRERSAIVSAAQLAEIALSCERDHISKLIWFTLYPGAVPNQRAEGLKALAFYAAIFPEFRTTPQVNEYVERGYDDFLSSNFAPDGGSLEQSFNYNGQDKEGLEEVLGFYGDNPPRFAKQIRERVAARRRVDDALQTPLGGLPQVGNAHDVLGKNVWESDAAAEKYWATPLDGKTTVRPQPFTSVSLPYSGFYAMRSGWGMKDLYLFFMNGRPQAGHSMRDNNAIQVTAYGRQLLVCGGDPTYGVFRTPEAKGADFYLSEASSLKNNTVIVDGRSQSKSGPHASRAYETPVLSRWHTSERCDLVDGLYDLGYGDFENNRDVNVDLSVQHYRRVVFVKPAKLWLVEDRMINTGDKPHQYTQVWNFAPYCEDPEYRKVIAGFKEDQFDLHPDGKRLRTADPEGPNIEIFHFGPALEYRKYHGNRDPWLGWYSAGIGDARPAVDIHVNWQSDVSDRLLTLLVPTDKGQDSPVAQATETLSDASSAGLDTTLDDGTRIRYVSRNEAQAIALGPVSANAEALMVCETPGESIWGLAVGCSELSIHGAAKTLPTQDFEFRMVGDQFTSEPIYIPRVPVISRPKPFLNMADADPLTIEAEPGYQVRYTLDGSEPGAQSALYAKPVALPEPCTVKARYFEGDQPLPLVATREFRPWQWAPREPEHATEDGLVRGMKYDYFERNVTYVRIYDLMLRTPDRSGVCDGLDMSISEPVRFCGVRWRGYLKVPQDGVYHFHLDTPETASVLIVNPERDLDLPELARCGWWGSTSTGSAALKAGLHCFEVQFMRSSKNEMKLEIEGPGVPRQELGADRLFIEP